MNLLYAKSRDNRDWQEFRMLTAMNTVNDEILAASAAEAKATAAKAKASAKQAELMSVLAELQLIQQAGGEAKLSEDQISSLSGKLTERMLAVLS